MAEALRVFSDEECGIIRATVIDLVKDHAHDQRLTGLAMLLLEAIDELVRRNAIAAAGTGDRAPGTHPSGGPA